MNVKKPIKYELYYRDESLGCAWREFFKGRGDVRVIAGDICQTDCNAIVSPANSFGFMDGGLDCRLSEFFGWSLQQEVQRIIRCRPLKELLVGESLVVPTGSDRIPWLIVAPTMRVPMEVNTTLNAYLAMKAILNAVKLHDQPPLIDSLAVPGLGTGVGRMDPGICACQMFEAYREIVMGTELFPKDFAEAQHRQLRLNPKGRHNG